MDGSCIDSFIIPYCDKGLSLGPTILQVSNLEYMDSMRASLDWPALATSVPDPREHGASAARTKFQNVLLNTIRWVGRGIVTGLSQDHPSEQEDQKHLLCCTFNVPNSRGDEHQAPFPSSHV